RQPVEMPAMGTMRDSPRRMIDPFPNCFSIWPRTSDSACLRVSAFSDFSLRSELFADVTDSLLWLRRVAAPADPLSLVPLRTKVERWYGGREPSSRSRFRQLHPSHRDVGRAAR